LNRISIPVQIIRFLFLPGLIIGISACQPAVTGTPDQLSRARQLEMTRFAEATARALKTANAVHQSVALTQTAAALIRSAGSPTPLPTYTFQPTYTPYPTFTLSYRTATAVRNPTYTVRPTFAPVFHPVAVSSTEFYCTQEPSNLKISVNLPQGVGGAVYYRLREKRSRELTQWQKKDLMLDHSNMHRVVINGSRYTQEPCDIEYPALPTESVFEFQIISDDGLYRSLVYTHVTYFPCPAEN